MSSKIQQVKKRNNDVPHLQKEIALLKQGYRFVAGLDEAGRGAWAGPVVAAAVIFPLDHPTLTDIFIDLRDSKQLSPQKREVLFDLIQQNAIAVAVGEASAKLVDQLNVVEATRHAMQQALTGLKVSPTYLLLDHLRLPAIKTPQEAFPKADNISLTVAAASVVAKVTRDQLMVRYHRLYPDYAFDRHKGYGTLKHRTTLAEFGPCPLHRASFNPIQLLNLKCDQAS